MSNVTVTGSMICHNNSQPDMQSIRILQPSDVMVAWKNSDRTIIARNTAPITEALPEASFNPGRILSIRAEVGSGGLNLTGNINDVPASTLSLTAGMTRTIQALGNAWYVIAN